MSSFLAKKLDVFSQTTHDRNIEKSVPRPPQKPISSQSRKPVTATVVVRRAIEEGGEHYWQVQDFPELSALAVSQALSRLAHSGFIKRVTPLPRIEVISRKALG